MQSSEDDDEEQEADKYLNYEAIRNKNLEIEYDNKKMNLNNHLSRVRNRLLKVNRARRAKKEKQEVEMTENPWRRSIGPSISKI